MAGSVGSEDGDIGFQIAPMVDVVFVLMLFFMACAGQQVTERELSINLPSGGTTPNQVNKTPVFIDISKDGQVSLNQQNFDTPTDETLKALRGKLKDNIERFGDKDPVIIRPANETKHKRIIEVLNAAAAAGVKNLTFS